MGGPCSWVCAPILVRVCACAIGVFQTRWYHYNHWLFLSLFRGDSLSSSHVFTHALSHSLSQGGFIKFVETYNPFNCNMLSLLLNTIINHSILSIDILTYTIPYHPMLPLTTPYHIYVTHWISNCKNLQLISSYAILLVYLKLCTPSQITILPYLPT